MPGHDLEAFWEAHCRYEFETRDVDATMATMVVEPQVNHVRTMTGGVGHDELKRFYKYHFIGVRLQAAGTHGLAGAERLISEIDLGRGALVALAERQASVRREVGLELRGGLRGRGDGPIDVARSTSALGLNRCLLMSGEERDRVAIGDANASTACSGASGRPRSGASSAR